jgi:hypothetical protein
MWGGDNGIAKMWNRREISVSSYDDPSHYLHPHPYIWLHAALPDVHLRRSSSLM